MKEEEKIEKLEEISSLLLKAEELIGDFVREYEDGEDLQESIESTVNECQEHIDAEMHIIESGEAE